MPRSHKLGKAQGYFVENDFVYICNTIHMIRIIQKIEDAISKLISSYFIETKSEITCVAQYNKQSHFKQNSLELI